MVCRVVILRFTFAWVLAKPRSISMSSPHWPRGSSKAAMAATAWEANVPASWDAEPSVVRVSYLILALASAPRPIQQSK
jgi:hypothetical protein